MHPSPPLSTGFTSVNPVREMHDPLLSPRFVPSKRSAPSSRDSSACSPASSASTPRRCCKNYSRWRGSDSVAGVRRRSGIGKVSLRRCGPGTTDEHPQGKNLRVSFDARTEPRVRDGIRMLSSRGRLAVRDGIKLVWRSRCLLSRVTSRKERSNPIAVAREGVREPSRSGWSGLPRDVFHSRKIEASHIVGLYSSFANLQRFHDLFLDLQDEGTKLALTTLVKCSFRRKPASRGECCYSLTGHSRFLASIPMRMRDEISCVESWK